jgi:hypothetical protein
VSTCPHLEALPNGLHCGSLEITNCPITALPVDLHITDTLLLDTCKELEALPARLLTGQLTVQNCPTIKVLSAESLSARRLRVSNCPQLEALSPMLTTPVLIVADCPALKGLPETLFVDRQLDIAGWEALTAWPRMGVAFMGKLDMPGCTGLRSLPSWLSEIYSLDIRDCANLREFPKHLRVRQMELAGSGLQGLPRKCRKTELTWRGVPISHKAAFHPEMLRAKEILREQNVEIRRVLLERIGFERFIADAQAATIDRDIGAGGARRLLRGPRVRGEHPVYLVVLDPSTGRQYLLRVPPHMRTCHQAAAWVAGFDNPDDYHPIVET